ncbi:MAG: RluA family pseudouridine synthase [Mobilitalea sp.]
MRFSYTIREEHNGHTIEQVLKEEFKISSQLLKNIKLYGSILVNGRKQWTKDSVHNGDILEAGWDFAGKEAGHIICDSIPILYQDDCFLIVVKPSNLCVHPSKGHGYDSLITRLNGGNGLHVVTRLDKDTSGLVLLAKNGYWHNQLSNIEIIKRYYGVVEGKLEPAQSLVDAPIQRESEDSVRRIVHSQGKRAITAYKVLDYLSEVDLSVVGFQLFTGRCHQIRVHTSYLGHPLVGDNLYGSIIESTEGQRLVCGKLQFIHPRDQVLVEVSLPSIGDILWKNGGIKQDVCNKLDNINTYIL